MADLGSVAWFASDTVPRVALVGHSFGAVVVRAGAASPAVAAVSALSSQSQGTEGVFALAPRPLLLLHATDEVLPVRCLEDIHRRTGERRCRCARRASTGWTSVRTL